MPALPPDSFPPALHDIIAARDQHVLVLGSSFVHEDAVGSSKTTRRGIGGLLQIHAYGNVSHQPRVTMGRGQVSCGRRCLNQHC